MTESDSLRLELIRAELKGLRELTDNRLTTLTLAVTELKDLPMTVNTLKATVEAHDEWISEAKKEKKQGFEFRRGTRPVIWATFALVLVGLGQALVVVIHG